LRGYRPAQAQQLSNTQRKEAFKARKLIDDVKSSVKVLNPQELRPQQAVGYLARHKGISLQYETVYQLIYTDKVSIQTTAGSPH
jgi:IS30 family transposase